MRGGMFRAIFLVWNAVQCKKIFIAQENIPNWGHVRCHQVPWIKGLLKAAGRPG